MGDGIRLHDLEGRDGLAHLIKQALGRAVHEVGLVAGDAGAVRRGNFQMVALLKRNGIVKGHCQAQRVKTGANVALVAGTETLIFMAAPFLCFITLSLPPAGA